MLESAFEHMCQLSILASQIMIAVEVSQPSVVHMQSTAGLLLIEIREIFMAGVRISIVQLIYFLSSMSGEKFSNLGDFKSGIWTQHRHACSTLVRVWILHPFWVIFMYLFPAYLVGSLPATTTPCLQILLVVVCQSLVGLWVHVVPTRHQGLAYCCCVPKPCFGIPALVYICVVAVSCLYSVSYYPCKCLTYGTNTLIIRVLFTAVVCVTT